MEEEARLAMRRHGRGGAPRRSAFGRSRGWGCGGGRRSREGPRNPEERAAEGTNEIEADTLDGLYTCVGSKRRTEERVGLVKRRIYYYYVIC